jgi:HIRAN domain
MTSTPDTFDLQRAAYLAAHPGLTQVQEKRERILNRSTVPVDLPDVISCALVGMSFLPDYPACTRRVERKLSEAWWENQEDVPLPGFLRRNPHNEHDPNAVEAHVRHMVPSMLGHLPRAVAARLAPEIDNGIEWSCEIAKVRVDLDNPDNPGVDVRLTRQAPAPGTSTVDDVIVESVGEMDWAMLNFELATRSLPVPDSLDDMRAALIEVYRNERANKKGETS